ncbi:MAG: hypothetical protein LBE62_11885 [Azonexus sp.]|jgi:hypothetical protein|nr:hypothetical protein [Azonexus sp.]
MEWDPAAGSLTGQGAEYVKDFSPREHVTLHPIPRASHELSAEPLKSYVDMAAIIGRSHLLPDVLAPHYPYLEPDYTEKLMGEASGGTLIF